MSHEALFRFAVGDGVRVVTHPARPPATVTARWTGPELDDVHDENIYAVTGFVTRQRESSLAREGWEPIPLEPLQAWRIAGRGGFHRAGPGVIESEGGPGLLWWPQDEFEDFLLQIDWRASSPEDDSGVFLRVPPLGAGGGELDWQPAVAEGYEVQIDDRGVDPSTGRAGSARHRTGAVHGLAPAAEVPGRPGRWNTFTIAAEGPAIRVALNGVPVSELTGAAGRRRRGYLALQAHGAGSRVAFRNLQVRRLEGGQRDARISRTLPTMAPRPMP